MYTRHIIPSDKYPMRYEGDTRRRESDSLLKVQFKGETQNYKLKEFYDMDRFIKYNEKIIDVDDVVNVTTGEYIIKNESIFGNKSVYDKTTNMDKCNINIITSQDDYLALLNRSNVIKQYIYPIIYEDGVAKLKSELTLISNLIYNAEKNNCKDIIDAIRTSLKNKEKDTDDTITLDEFTTLMADYYTEKGVGFDTTAYTTVKSISDAYESLLKRLEDLKKNMSDNYFIPYRSVYPSTNIEWFGDGYFSYQKAVGQNNIMKTAFNNLIPNGTDLPTVPRDNTRYDNTTATLYASLNEIYQDIVYGDTRIQYAISEYNKKLPMGLASGISFRTLINSYLSIKASTDTAQSDLSAYNTDIVNYIPNGDLNTTKYPTWNEIVAELEVLMSSIDNKLSKGETTEEIATYNNTYLVKYPNGNAFASVVASKLVTVANATGLKLLLAGTYSNDVKSIEDEITLMLNNLIKISGYINTITTSIADMLPTFITGDENISTEYTTAYSSLTTTENLDNILIGFKSSIDTLNTLDAKFENIKLTDPTLSSYRFIWNMV